MRLLAYDMVIVHRPGSQNQVPDALSRASEDTCVSKEYKTGDAWYLDQFGEVKNFPIIFLIGKSIVVICLYINLTPRSTL